MRHEVTYPVMFVCLYLFIYNNLMSPRLASILLCYSCSLYNTDYNYIAIGEGGLELLGLLSAGNIRALPHPVCVVLGMEPSASSLLGERSPHCSSPRGVLLITHQGLFV